MTAGARRAAVTAALVVASVAAAAGHDGPPFPIVSDQVSGPYLVSIWTDPDATDDGSIGGQFWVTVAEAQGRAAPPAATSVRVAIRAIDRPGREGTADVLSAVAEPVRGDVTNQFAALLMDHEGPYAVHVTISGPLGTTTVDAEVDATYDLRPPAGLLVLYVLPFVLAGLLWGRLLLRRRASRHSPQPKPRAQS